MLLKAKINLRLKNLMGTLCYLFMLTVFLSFQLKAQQYDQWAFGNGASLDINATGTNAYLSPATQINTMEGCASYCDPTGGLWFYTDGRHIFNYNLSTTCSNCLNGMPNGSRASQGVVIVPKPGGASHEFYIFTVSDFGGINHGLSYVTYNALSNTVSTVTTMGITPGTFGSYCHERIQAVPNCTGDGYWVVVKPVIKPATTTCCIGSGSPTPTAPAGASNTSLYAYGVSASGVTAKPVISDAGYAADINPSSNHLGDAKFSPNKELYATAVRTNALSGETHLHRFNCATGSFIHLQNMPFRSSYAVNSVSFSPDSKKLYATGYTGGWFGNLRQYDLTDLKCNPYTIPPFCDHLTSFATGALSYLQLGSNGTLYRSRPFSNYVDAVVSPNAIGCTNMDYVTNFKKVSSTTTNSVNMGLPNNIDGLITNPIESLTSCSQGCNVYSFWLTGCSSNLTWDFGDGSGIVSGFSDLTIATTTTNGSMLMPTHTFPTSGGTYTVTASGSGFSVSTVVTVLPTPAPTVSGTGFPLCSGSSTAANVSITNSFNFSTIDWTDCSAAGNSYTFPNASGTNYVINANTVPSGTYTLCATGTTSNGCTSTSMYTFTVTDGDWPKTTTNTENYDWASGTEMDQFEDIYICGEFREETEFEGYTVVGNGSAQVNAYLAKYNSCGGLDWIARSLSNSTVTRRSMSLSENLKNIYVTGRCQGTTTFYPGEVPPFGSSSCGSSPITINGDGLYIAIYDYDGCLLNVHMMYDNGSYVYDGSRVTNSISFGTNDRVYIAANVTANNPSNNVKMLAYSFIQSGVNLNMQWAREFSSSVQLRANDIDAYDNTVCITGKHTRDLWYYDPLQTYMGANSNVEEAYVIGLNEMGTSSQIMPNFTRVLDYGTSAPSESSGEGVDCLNADHIFLTGTFINDVSDPFGIAGLLSYNASSINETDAYLVSISNVNSNNNWAHTIWNKNESTYGQAVKAVGNQVFVTGRWTGQYFFVDNTFLQSLDYENHIYTMAFEFNGDFISPNAWQNHSIYASQPQSQAWMYSSSIASNGDMVYVGGSYYGKYGMMNDIAVNSPLASTPSGVCNMFLWRFDNGQQGLSRNEPIEDEQAVISNVSSELNLYPNPAQDYFTIVLENDNPSSLALIAVFDIAGKQVHEDKVLNNSLTINTQNWNKGMYLVKVTANGKTYTKKVVVN